jgi:hypothetical protein
MIIGLCGAAGCGKNTVAEMLAARQGAGIFGFADPLYAAISAITGMSIAELQDRRHKERDLPWLPASPRRLLQTIGTEWGRETIHPEIWVMATMKRIEDSEAVIAVITDVRFDNEAEAIHARGGYVWRVVRPGAGLAGSAGSHSSERGIEARLVDDEVLNDGDLSVLAGRVDAAWSRLQNDTMK